MTPLVIGLVLLAALLHASWNAMAKSGGTPEYSIASYQLVGAVVCLPLVFFVPAPLPESWPMIIASVIWHNLYYFTLAMSYRTGDLSQMYPLFRGLAPVLVALGAALFAEEWLSPGSLAGIGLISFGLTSLTLFGGKLGRISPLALCWGLATSVLIAVYSVTDGLGVRAAGNSYSYIFWLFLLEPVP
ncbi:MAG: EamA family transporter, partial [Gammaproteobacteria bacterium]|nr:EamA family transporter [Gammaproteobacteria bacterium]